MRPIDLIVVHHSASPLSATAADIALWHAARFKFGIGYHRIIEADGMVLDGRKLQRQGAHARGSNTRSIGLCVIGNNTREGCHWTGEQEYSLVLTLTYLCDMYPLARVCGHRDTRGAATECPGLDIRDWCRLHDLDVPPFQVIQ